MGTREARWRAVARFAANVLREGRDRFGPEPTPLFADRLDLADRSPIVWAYRGSAHPAGEWVVSNLALQQNLLRTLVGFSALSGEAPHHEAAAAAVAWHCDHLASPCGLLRWGGHQFVDLRGKTRSSRWRWWPWRPPCAGRRSRCPPTAGGAGSCRGWWTTARA